MKTNWVNQETGFSPVKVIYILIICKQINIEVKVYKNLWHIIWQLQFISKIGFAFVFSDFCSSE